MCVQIHSQQVKAIATKLYRSMPNHLFELDEVVQLGNVAVLELYKKNPNGNFNKTFINNTVRWTIFNELRARKLRDGNAYGQVLSLDSTDYYFDTDIPFTQIYKHISETDNLDEKIDTEFAMKIVTRVLDYYSKRDVQIFKMFFFDEKTQAEIGKKFNLSGSRVCRLLNKMVTHLRLSLQDF